MIKEFFKLESAGGILLSLAALFALAIKNSILSDYYDLFVNLNMSFHLGDFSLQKSLLLWINDGLMAIFFLVVSLEIKRELYEGELSTPKQLTLPIIAAIGGFIGPALFYSFINWGNDIAMQGWAIPAATDIAFALGVLSLLGNRVPKQLKVCLVGLAIFDDIVAIIVIAIFYTSSLSFTSLSFSSLAILGLIILNIKKVKILTPYILVGIFLWLCVLKSGVHATLAGVILGLFIPIRTVDNSKDCILKKLEHTLHPWVAFFILPMFAFANAGVSFQELTLETLLQPVSLGIILGLCLGAPLGVLSLTVLFKFFKLTSLPSGVSITQYIGMSVLTGIGFTMSLFIGGLAFDSLDYQNTVRLSVLIGSVISGIIGTCILFLAKKPS